MKSRPKGRSIIRAWEPEPGEATARNQRKPWAAFKVFRDAGPGRTLKAAAAAYYGYTKDALPEHLYTTVRRWSAKFSWQERAQAFDDHYTMRERAAIEEFQQSKAQEFAERQMALREKLLSNAEEAAEQAAKMLSWTLAEQRIFREEAGNDGEDVTYVFVPAKWSKATVRGLQDMAAAAVAGTWSSKIPEESDNAEFDFSSFSDEELRTYIRLSEKLNMVRRPRD